MTRPCTWPDGGCGEPIIDVTTIGGRLQVLNPDPDLVGNIVIRDGRSLTLSGQIRPREGELRFIDHHATCSAWARKIERERAAKAGQP